MTIKAPWENAKAPWEEDSQSLVQQESPEEATGVVSSFTGGVKRGVDQTQALLGGAAGLAGSALGFEGLESWGQETYKSNMKEAQRYIPKEGAATFAESDSAEDYANWAAGTLGSLVPTMVTSMAGGGIGGIAGKMLLGNTLKGQALKQTAAGIIKRGATTALDKKRLAQAAFPTKLGQAVGAGSTSVALESGGIYGRQVAGEGLDEQNEPDVGTALLYGVPAGLLDAIVPAKLLGKFGVGRGAGDAALDGVKGGKLAEALRGAIKTAPMEGMTEVGQGILERAAQVDYEGKLDTPEGLDQVFDSEAALEEFMAGLLGGGVFGGAAGAVQGKRAQEQKKAAERKLMGEIETRKRLEEAQVKAAAEKARYPLQEEGLVKPAQEAQERKQLVGQLQIIKGQLQDERAKKRPGVKRVNALQKQAEALTQKLDTTRASPLTQMLPEEKQQIIDETIPYTEEEKLRFQRKQVKLNEDQGQAERERQAAFDVVEQDKTELRGDTARLSPLMDHRRIKVADKKGAGIQDQALVERRIAEKGSSLGQPLNTPEMRELRGQLQSKRVSGPLINTLAESRRLERELGAEAEPKPLIEERMDVEKVRSDQAQLDAEKGVYLEGGLEPGKNQQEIDEAARLAVQEGEKRRAEVGQPQVTEEAAGRLIEGTDLELASVGETETPRTVEQARDRLSEGLGAGTVRRAERTGFLKVLGKKEWAEQGYDSEINGLFLEKGENGKPQVLVRAESTEDPLAIALHEGEHAGVENLLGSSYRGVQNQLVRMERGKDERALDAARRAEASVDHWVKGYQQKNKGRTPPRAEVQKVREKEKLAYFIQGAQLREGGKAAGILKRVLDSVRAWWRTTEMGKAWANQGTKELTDGMALALAKRAFKVEAWKAELDPRGPEGGKKADGDTGNVFTSLAEGYSEGLDSLVKKSGGDMGVVAKRLETASAHPATKRLAHQKGRLHFATQEELGNFPFHEIVDGFYDPETKTFLSREEAHRVVKEELAPDPFERNLEVLESQVLRRQQAVTGQEKGVSGLHAEELASVAQEGTPEFKEWFGNSKAVDVEGKPLVVYHGTDAASIETFKPGQTGYRTFGLMTEEVKSNGFFFSPSREDAGSYGTNVEAYYLSAQKPLINPQYLPMSSRATEEQKAESEKAWNDIEYILAPAMYEGSQKQKMIDSDNGTSSVEIDADGNWLNSVFNDNHLDWAFLDNAKVVERMKQRGYDSVKVYDPNDASGEAWFVVAPNQIKSATKNRGTFDPADPSILASVSEGFYSPLGRVVEGAKQEKAPGAQWLGWLKKQPGVKQEEVEDLGLEEWLEGREGAVTKGELEEFIKQGGIKIEEVIKDRGFVASDRLTPDQREEYERLGRIPGMELTEAQDTRLDELEELRLSEAPPSDTTKFADYQEPGGENYRELLLMLPTKEVTTNDVAQKLFGKDINFLEEDERLQVSQELRRIWESEANFRSGHFDEPNVVAHIRFNERIDAEGKKVLFVEEVQSDWHQKGKKGGYQGNYTQELTQLKEQLAKWEVLNMRFQKANQLIYQSAEGADNIELRMQRDQAVDEMNASEINPARVIGRIRKLENNAVPNAPFKSSWPLLAMKRAIQWGAENGFDRVAWTPGEVQADRYDLSKQVERIVVPTINENNRAVRIDSKEGTSFKLMVSNDSTVKGYKSASQFNDKKLDEVVGKELAEKIMALESPKDFSGLDLKVGGQGMKSFYDRQLPNMLGKYLKKQGWGKVGTTEIDPIGETWAVDISPEMRKGVVEEGQPMFSLADSASISGTPQYTLPSVAASSSSDLNTEIKQKPTVMKRVRDSLRRGWAPGGHLGFYAPGAHNEIISRDSSQNMWDAEAERFVHDLEKVVKRETGMGMRQQDQEYLNQIDDALKGDEVAFNGLSGGVQDTVAVMREYLDRFSGEYMEALRADANRVASEAQEREGEIERLKGKITALPEGVERTRLEKQKQGLVLENNRILQDAVGKTELIDIIEGNLGKWVNRSFRVFDDKNWPYHVPNDVLDDARAFLIKDEGMTEQQAQAYMNKLLKDMTAFDTFEDWMVREGKAGMLDLRTLKEKQDIPEPLLALLGEYKDPRVNFSRSAAKVTRLVFNTRLLQRLRKVGTEQGWFAEARNLDAQKLGMTHTMQGGKGYEPLAGLVTFPEVEQGLKDILGHQPWPEWLENVVKVTSFTKRMKTIWSPLPTTARNYISSLMALIANADGNWQGLYEGWQAAREYVTNTDLGRQRDRLRHLSVLGVSYDTPFAGELQDLLKDTKLQDALLVEGEPGTIKGPGVMMRRYWQDAEKFMTRGYQFGDDLTKITAFHSKYRTLDRMIGERTRAQYQGQGNQMEWENGTIGEVKLLEGKDGKWSFRDQFGNNITEGDLSWEEQGTARAEAPEVLAKWHLEKEAAERIRNTYQTYSLVGRTPRFLRKFPLTGTFVSFPVEMIRTVANMVGYIKKDMKDPDLRPMAIRQMVGMTLAASAAYTAEEWAKKALGVDDEELDAARESAAPWNQLSNMVPVGRNERGDLELVDFGYMDLYAMWHTLPNALMSGQPTEEALRKAAVQLAAPFFGIDITAGAVNEALNNRKSGGGQIWDPKLDNGVEQFEKIGKHLLKGVAPSTLVQAEKIFQATQGTSTTWGEKLDAGKELLALGGWKTQTVDPSRILNYGRMEFQMGNKDVSYGLGKVVGDPNEVEKEELEERVGKALEARKKNYEKMLRKVRAAKKLGMTEAQMVTQLRRFRMPKADVAALVRERVPLWRPGRDLFKSQVEKARLLFKDEPEKWRDVEKRRREVLEMIRRGGV